MFLLTIIQNNLLFYFLRHFGFKFTMQLKNFDLDSPALNFPCMCPLPGCCGAEG